jgi:hypothetical protein
VEHGTVEGRRCEELRWYVSWLIFQGWSLPSKGGVKQGDLVLASRKRVARSHSRQLCRATRQNFLPHFHQPRSQNSSYIYKETASSLPGYTDKLQVLESILSEHDRFKHDIELIKPASVDALEAESMAPRRASKSERTSPTGRRSSCSRGFTTPSFVVIVHRVSSFRV